MNARIQRHGKGLALHIPTAIAAELGLHDGAPVTLHVVAGQLVVATESSPFITLEELLAGVTDENRHEETDWGPPVGNEVW